MCEYCINEADRMVSPSSQKGIKIKMCKACYDRTQAKQRDKNIKFIKLNTLSN